jgi:hypothetical protein
MTTTAKPICRQTLSQIRYRGKWRFIVFEAAATAMAVRLKGTRVRYAAAYEQIFKLAAENAARAARAERQAQRRAKS